MSYEQKALEILRVMAQTAAEGKSLTIADDWGFGSATVIDQDGAHTHIGHDGYEDEQRGLEAFVDGLHDLLVNGRGLSWDKPSNRGVEGARTMNDEQETNHAFARSLSNVGLGSADKQKLEYFKSLAQRLCKHEWEYMEVQGERFRFCRICTLRVDEDG